MLSKEVLEEQETVELPAREMMDLNFINVGGWLAIQQNNSSIQHGYYNVNVQQNSISLSF